MDEAGILADSRHYDHPTPVSDKAIDVVDDNNY